MFIVIVIAIVIEVRVDSGEVYSQRQVMITIRYYCYDSDLYSYY
jgi:hypothetical protein